MRVCEVAVIGLGVMGTAALRALTKRGVNALGFDPLVPGEPRGSSHGSCRIFRRFNFESEAYTALSDRAFAGWKALEAESGESLLLPTPVLAAGPAGSALVAASRAAATRAGVAGGPGTGAEVNARFPAFRLPADWDAVVQDGGAVLLADRAMRGLRSGLEDRIVAKAAWFEPRRNAIAVTTADGERYTARTVIVAAGPWIGDLIPELRPHIKVTRQVVGWFAPSAPGSADPDAFPIFLLEAPQGVIYGLPDFEGRGVKAGFHDHGAETHPDQLARDATDNELAGVGAAFQSLVPGVSTHIREREVCLYTNTRGSDVDGSAAEEFIIDRLPSDPRIVVASPCSGHGFKFATAIGDILADLALDPDARADPAFRLDRFSSFVALG